jgi:CBS-domain-containing membrane protein
VAYANRVRVVSESDAIQSLPTLLREAEKQTVVVRDGDRELAAIVSMKDYETIRKAKVERLKMAMQQYGDSLRADATEAGISLDELERMLDRKAP